MGFLLVESLIASIVIGKIRGGKLSRISYIRFKKVWLFIIALLIQLGIIVFSSIESSILFNYLKELYIASFILLFIGIIFNANFKSLWTIFIGAALNMVPFIYNNGKIPISIDGLKLAGLSDIAQYVHDGKLALYTPITEATKHAFLGDIITIPAPYPFPQMLSIGDMLIALGLFIFIQSIMLDRNIERSNMVRFKYRSRI